jgi:holo-[acyl-carrier protein] synthase
MPARPFPLPFRIGTDICRVDRIQRIICARRAPALLCPQSLARFLRKILTDGEIVAFRAAKRDAASPRAVAEHLAGRYVLSFPPRTCWRGGAKGARWAAKEAIIKASPRKLFMRDIVVRRGPGSLVGVVMDPAAGGGLVVSAGSAGDGLDGVSGQEVLLSISHEREYAVATAVVPT